MNAGVLLDPQMQIQQLTRRFETVILQLMHIKNIDTFSSSIHKYVIYTPKMPYILYRNRLEVSIK